jgi:hypothetical protein
VSPIATQTQDAPFDVTVGLYDANDNPTTNAGASGLITLTRQAGTGTLGGTTTGTVAVGAGSIVISGVTYGTAENGVRFLATGSGAGASVAGKTGTSSTFTVSGPQGGCASHNYTTTFPLTEFPISEGGCWWNGKTDGLDWSDVYTTPGKAMGNQTGRSFTDGTALLKGTWGPDQDATATVFTAGSVDDICYPEVELRLRSTITPHNNVGYEIAHRVSSIADSYLIVVRWNGPLGDFTYLRNLRGSQYGVRNGDVVRATISGHVITVYKNGQVETTVDVTDAGPAFTSGTPGVGFNLENGNGSQCPGNNSSYGFSRFSATDGTP